MEIKYIRSMSLLACALFIISCGSQSSAPDLPSRTQSDNPQTEASTSGGDSDSSTNEEIQPIIKKIQITKRNRKCSNKPCDRGFWLDVTSRTIHSYGPGNNYGVIAFEAKNESKLIDLFTGAFARILKEQMLDCSRTYYPDDAPHYELIVTVSDGNKFRRNVTQCIANVRNKDSSASRYARKIHEIQSVFWEEFFKDAQ